MRLARGILSGPGANGIQKYRLTYVTTYRKTINKSFQFDKRNSTTDTTTQPQKDLQR